MPVSLSLAMVVPRPESSVGMEFDDNEHIGPVIVQDIRPRAVFELRELFGELTARMHLHIWLRSISMVRRDRAAHQRIGSWWRISTLWRRRGHRLAARVHMIWRCRDPAARLICARAPRAPACMSLTSVVPFPCLARRSPPASS